MRLHEGVNTSVNSSSVVQCSPRDSKHQRVATRVESTLVLHRVSLKFSSVIAIIVTKDINRFNRGVFFSNLIVAAVGVMTSGIGLVGAACAGAATIAICRKIMEKCSSYAKWLDEFKTNKQIELKNLNQRIKVIEVKVPCLKQMMDEIEETPGCCSFAFCQWLSKLWRRRRLHH